MQKLNIIKDKIKEIVERKQLKTNPQIIAISKKFDLDVIEPLIHSGHNHFGENVVQEAEKKWLSLKNYNKNLKLHMVGKLQTNKAKKAVKLFDYIHSLDNVKLATKLSQFEKELDKKIKIFIQVNLGKERQKSGISLDNLNEFYSYCKNKLNLNIIGLMCIPPIDSDTNQYFKSLKECSKNLSLKELSMGMSSDYENAVLNDGTFLRIGTAIFGERKPN